MFESLQWEGIAERINKGEEVELPIDYARKFIQACSIYNIKCNFDAHFKKDICVINRM